MYGGFSGSQGVLLFNTNIEGTNGVYGYYDGEEIVLVEGEYKALRKQQNQREEAYRRDTNETRRDMGVLLLLDLLMIVAAFRFGTFLSGLAVTVFAVGSYFPLLILRAARRNDYRTKALFDQFRRFHGCEHQTVSWLTRAKASDELTEAGVQRYRIYDAECGTAYAGYWLTLAVVLTALIVSFPTLGFLKAAGILLLTIVLLLVNVFNPWNPFFLLQRRVVDQPGEWEYRLALAAAERLRKL